MQEEINLRDIPVARFLGRSLRFGALFFCASALLLTVVFGLGIPILFHVLLFFSLPTFAVGAGIAHSVGLPIPGSHAGYIIVVSLTWALMLLPFRFVHLVFLHLYITPGQKPAGDILHDRRP